MDLFSFIRGKPQPREIARERLKLVLVHDRANCSPRVLEMLKSDILDVISNYMDIDQEDMDVRITQENTDEASNVPVLYANIPIKGLRNKGQRNS
ncbi:MAG: cell division topological specificity factor MinE [Defluviitaleaceae bacterium]|nr:cell division topological specificity factor MinE [Defluviitaleaceae bacterium]